MKTSRKKSSEVIELIKTLYIENIPIKEIGVITDSDVVTVIKYLNQFFPNRIKNPTKFKRKYPFKEDFFTKIDSGEKAYFLGFIYADGCLKEKDNYVTIALKSEDKYILERFRDFLQTEKPIYFEPPKRIKGTEYISSGSYRLTVSSKQFYEDLKSYGLHPRKSLTLEFPELPDEYTSHFIRGYFDGDGSVSKSNANNACINILGTKSFCQSILGVLGKENIYSNVMLDKKGGNIHKIQITGRADFDRFKSYIYNDSTIHLNRKYQIFKDWEHRSYKYMLRYDKRKKKGSRSVLDN